MLVRFSLKKPRSLVIYTRPTNELLTTFQPASQLTKTKSRAHIETSWKEAGRVRGPEGERSRRNSAKEPEKFGPEGAKTKTRLHRSRRPTYQRIAERQKERERGKEKDWTENQQKGEKNRENGGRRKERGNEKEGRCRYYGGPRESRNADTHTHTHTYTHIQIDHQRGKGKEKPKEQEDGVKRTHREPRSHDLMNELAWLLATWWGGYSPSLPLPPLRPSSTGNIVHGISAVLSVVLFLQEAKPRPGHNVVGVTSSWIYGRG